MKKVLSWAISAAVVLWISGITAGAAPLGLGPQGHSGGHGQAGSSKGKKVKSGDVNSVEKGKKPEDKGLARAVDVANEKGVTHGISKAETKQGEHGLEDQTAGDKGHKGKHLAKGKGKGKAMAKGQNKDKAPE